ncbi:MAG: VCBS repeat-containing protein [Lentisphaerales bacterium]|nr:VCBS repeat-containing protein [Lentisphaerales bacterium]
MRFLLFFIALPLFGEISFQQIEIAKGYAVNSARAWDYNKDGHKDVLYTGDGYLHLALGPDYKPQKVLDIPDGFSRAIHSRLIDIDGDGDMDMVGTDRGVYWLECPDNPLDQWTYHQITLDFWGIHCILIHDFNRDGKLDVIVNNFNPFERFHRSKMFKNLYQNSVLAYQIPANPKDTKQWQPNIIVDQDAPGGSHYFDIVDVDNDGKQEFMIGAVGGKIFKGGHYFAMWKEGDDPEKPWRKIKHFPNQTGASHIYGVDLNGDNVKDMLACRGHGLGVLWFKGPNYEAIEIDPKIQGPHAFDKVDLDSDGDMDMVATDNRSKQLIWYENDGKANFTKHIIFENQKGYDLDLQDLNQDGKVDIVVSGSSGRDVRVYIQK